IIYFFFSSRRRHTRSDRDWSSDVCSSDLAGLTPDHDGTQLSIKVKSPVPMAVAVLPSSIAGQLYGSPDMFESAVGKSACQQRGVQSSTLQCTLNLADGA